ncbi:hypothetical protein Q7P35_007200 [Cladosporium inversicolor]
MGHPDIPSSAPTSSQLGPAKAPPSYRNVQPLPAQLLDHCTVCLEEQLFSQAIPLLSSAITAGNGTPKPAFVPPAPHLSLLATLVVHPSMTTRTTSKEKQTAADDALRYLRHVNTLTSADASGLTKALQFRDGDSSRSKRARTRHSGDISSDDEHEDPGRIRSNYAMKDSLFANVEDFWAVVGWAFNCSVAHKNRWDRWRLWLEFALDVLEDDLDSRHRQARESPEDRDEVLGKSLLAHYLAPFVDQGRNPKRRIMRAVLADGTQPSINLFPSVFTNETLPPKAKQESRLGVKRSLDLDQGDFGDYFDSDSDSNTTPGPQQKSGRTSTRHSSTNLSRQDSPASPSTPQPPTTSSLTSPLSSHGGSESLHLRLRLLALLTTISSLSPSLFLDPEDLFDLYTEFLRPLPLPIFSFFILPTTSVARRTIDVNSLASLIQMLLRPLLSSVAPVSNANSLTAESFATHFAPFAANVSSVGENARVGICVEGLLRLLWTEGVLTNAGEQVRKGVKEAVEEGIKAREERASGDGRRKSARKSAEEWRFLVAGGERMKGLLGMI